MVSEAQVLKALSQIIDPDFQKDIVSLGFVKQLKINGDVVGFDIELTTPACPVKEKFRSDAEAVVLALDGVNVVNINMTAQERKPATAIQDSGLKNIESIIAVSSCKGGVGKSSVAAMLAKEVASRGFKVGLLDADIFGPSVPVLFDLRETGVRVSEDKMFLPEEVDGLKLMSFGFWAGDAPAVMRGPMVANYTQQLLHQVKWGKLDYLFIDMPPGTGDIHLTISQNVQMAGSVIVTTPHSLSLADVGKGILMFDKVNVPVLGVIENMSYFETPTGERYNIFGTGGGKKLQDRFGLDILAELPIMSEISGGRTIDGSDVARETADQVIKALGKSSRVQGGMPEVDFDEEMIHVTWSDGQTSNVPNLELRANCKCAHCVDEMTGAQRLERRTIAPDIRAEEIRIIGNYALSVKWSDGHSTGLYTYKIIKDLAQAPAKA